jgi:lysophospholipase L1-like esterase
LSAPAQAPARALRWVALGDSFTAGTAAGETTWAELVLASTPASAGLQLRCLARMGATVAEVRAKQLGAAIAGQPHVVTAICGGNDVIGTVRPSLGAVADELDGLFSSLREALPPAALLTATYPPTAPAAWRPRTRRRIEAGLVELNEIVRASAARHRFVCVELADHPGRGSRRNYADDGMHPSAAGHEAAAAVLGPAITQVPMEERPACGGRRA